ncbi:hypothetical protein EDD11_006751 [Mortierella claussenii]|nr:hypothetical protein EDD11_006751 [Mortierella claussenii]
MSSPTPTPAPTKAPDSKGDTALFGKPSVIGSYNLTTGILIYSAFMILFLVAVGSATYRRAKYRNQFRQQQQRNMEGGRSTPGGKGATGKGSNAELSDAALFKQASISKRALMKDVGPGGVMAANELTKNRIAAANGAGRSYEERSGASQQSGQSIRFGESNGNNSRPTNGGTGRTGGMKKTNRGDVNQGGYEMNTYSEDSSRFYQDNYDTTDYSRPPLTESADPYYSSGGSSHSGYLDQAEEYHGPGASPQKPKAAYQHHQGQPSSSSTMSPSSSSSPQPQYSQPMFVQRTNSSRMPKTELHDGNNIFRSDSGRRTPGLERNGSGNGQPIRIATQGMLDRSGSSGPRSGATSPIDMGMSRAGSNASSSRTRVSPSPTQLHPTPIARSNSTRLPPSMRGAGTPQLSSNLSQQVNNYDYV